MEPIKSPSRVKKMFDAGEITMVDPASKYKYSLVAKCPNDGELSYVERWEKKGHSLGDVTFKCAKCFGEFQARIADIMII